jgi:hypothetical protein
MIQAGQISEAQQRTLAAGMRAIGRDLFGDGPDAEVAWVTIERGFGFTAGRPSTSSLIARAIPHGSSEHVREEFMAKVCGLWTDVTGRSAIEIVVTAPDEPAKG